MVALPLLTKRDHNHNDIYPKNGKTRLNGF